MYILETLFEKSQSKQRFISNYKPTTSTLPVFAKIHDELDEEATSLQEASDLELSEIEMSPEMLKATSDTYACAKLRKQGSSSFLNSTFESSTVED